MAAQNTLPIRRLQKFWVGVMRSVISLAMIMYAGLTVATLDMFVFHVSVTDGREYLRAAPALRFGLMRSDEPWFQLLPGAVFALITYCCGSSWRSPSRFQAAGSGASCGSASSSVGRRTPTATRCFGSGSSRCSASYSSRCCRWWRSATTRRAG